MPNDTPKRMRRAAVAGILAVALGAGVAMTWTDTAAAGRVNHSRWNQQAR